MRRAPDPPRLASTSALTTDDAKSNHRTHDLDGRYISICYRRGMRRRGVWIDVHPEGRREQHTMQHCEQCSPQRCSRHTEVYPEAAFNAGEIGVSECGCWWLGRRNMGAGKELSTPFDNGGCFFARPQWLVNYTRLLLHHCCATTDGFS